MTEIRVAGIIIEDGEILTTKMEKDGEEYHVIPGGGVERDEDAEEALKREIKEETGLEINNFSLAYIRELNLEDDRGIELYYHVKSYTGEPKTGYDPEDKESNLREVEKLDINKLTDKDFFPEQISDKIPEDAANNFPQVKHLGLHQYSNSP